MIEWNDCESRSYRNTSVDYGGAPGKEIVAACSRCPSLPLCVSARLFGACTLRIASIVRCRYHSCDRPSSLLRRTWCSGGCLYLLSCCGDTRSSNGVVDVSLGRASHASSSRRGSERDQRLAQRSFTSSSGCYCSRSDTSHGGHCFNRCSTDVSLVHEPRGPHDEPRSSAAHCSRVGSAAYAAEQVPCRVEAPDRCSDCF